MIGAFRRLIAEDGTNLTWFGWASRHDLIDLSPLKYSLDLLPLCALPVGPSRS